MGVGIILAVVSIKNISLAGESFWIPAFAGMTVGNSGMRMARI